MQREGPSLPKTAFQVAPAAQSKSERDKAPKSWIFGNAEVTESV